MQRNIITIKTFYISQIEKLLERKQYNICTLITILKHKQSDKNIYDVNYVVIMLNITSL